MWASIVNVCIIFWPYFKSTGQILTTASRLQICKVTIFVLISSAATLTHLNWMKQMLKGKIERGLNFENCIWCKLGLVLFQSWHEILIFWIFYNHGFILSSPGLDSVMSKMLIIISLIFIDPIIFCTSSSKLKHNTEFKH